MHSTPTPTPGKTPAFSPADSCKLIDVFARRLIDLPAQFNFTDAFVCVVASDPDEQGRYTVSTIELIAVAIGRVDTKWFARYLRSDGSEHVAFGDDPSVEVDMIGYYIAEDGKFKSVNQHKNFAGVVKRGTDYCKIKAGLSSSFHKLCTGVVESRQ